jgi:hypothetical protein
MLNNAATYTSDRRRAEATHPASRSSKMREIEISHAMVTVRAQSYP